MVLKTDTGHNSGTFVHGYDVLLLKTCVCSKKKCLLIYLLCNVKFVLIGNARIPICQMNKHQATFSRANAC